MTFAVAADAYDRYMGRFSGPLAPLFADVAGIDPGIAVLDVGCGPGALTSELARRLGPANVTAVDPSESFVDAVRERVPGVRVETAHAEDLPFPAAAFDVSLAQLVVHFMSDPIAGLREMRRVTRDGGVVAACVWDHGGFRGPLSPFWAAARALDPGVVDESELAGARRGHLAELFGVVGLVDVVESDLEVSVEYRSFDDWWEPFTLGVGLAGDHVARLDARKRDDLERRCRELHPAPPFVITAHAWTARGVV